MYTFQQHLELSLWFVPYCLPSPRPSMMEAGQLHRCLIQQLVLQQPSEAAVAPASSVLVAVGPEYRNAYCCCLADG
jgi:hypothetical protein